MTSYLAFGVIRGVSTRKGTGTSLSDVVQTAMQYQQKQLEDHQNMYRIGNELIMTHI